MNTPTSFFATSITRFVSLVTLAVTLLVASPAAAYNISEQAVYRVADRLPVYTFTVPITAGSRSLHLPVWGTTHTPTATQFGYEFFSDTSAVSLDGGLGFILSDAPIVANEFVLAPNSSATFTIVIIGVPAANTAAQQVSARLTSLPLYLGDERTPAPYTAAELSNFVSDKVTIR
jgi:hypothetical protein